MFYIIQFNGQYYGSRKQNSQSVIPKTNFVVFISFLLKKLYNQHLFTNSFLIVSYKIQIKRFFQYNNILKDFEMCEVSQQQINCVFQTQGEVPIFDQDNWVTQQQTKQSQSQKNIVLKQKQEEYDPELIKKIDQQLQKSKQNFFKVKIVKPKVISKQVNQGSKNLKKIQMIAQKNTNTILKQGYINKKTDSFLFKWKMRYFALTSQKLYFFEDNKKEKVVGCINLKLIPTKVVNQDDQIILDFMGECENMFLKCQTKKQTQEWMAIIEQVVKYQSRQKKLLLKTMIKPLYNCQDSITQREFNKSAQTGDILLFYTKNTGAKIQRVITNSDFDHVAMVVKFRKNQTMVFQSNQIYGVSIYQWGQYIRYFDLYQKVTLRKLNSVRKSELHHSFLNFVKKNLGKKYDISAMKLLKFQSDFNWDQVNQDETRGYFCSQLVAKAYKSVGLIDQKKSSGRYWPVDFSQKNNLQLKNGAFLGSQQSIILNKHIKNTL